MTALDPCYVKEVQRQIPSRFWPGGLKSEEQVTACSCRRCALYVDVKRTEETAQQQDVMRNFTTGATRNVDASRYDPEAALCPLVLERFSEYMQKNAVQADGKLRPCDNWQKGMPRESYIKGLLRHTLHAWSRLRNYPVRDEKAATNLEEDLCAVLFNAQGLLLEVLLNRDTTKQSQPEGDDSR